MFKFIKESTEIEKQLTNSGKSGSKKSLDDAKKGGAGTDKLIEAEGMEVGSVKWSIFIFYIKSIGWQLALLVLLCQFSSQGSISILKIIHDLIKKIN